MRLLKRWLKDILLEDWFFMRILNKNTNNIVYMNEALDIKYQNQKRLDGCFEAA